MGLLTGKTALVSGVANPRSIAWGIAQVFHEHGARIAFTCLESTHRRVTKLAGDLGSDLVLPCDVAKDDDIARTFDELGKAFDGKLDVLVHSIAYAKLEDMSGEFLNVTREGWRLALEVSAYSLVAMARAARPLMKAAGGGSILTLTFAGGNRVAPRYNIMGIAKAALESTVRYLAYDLGPDGIRVNALSPGPIPTVSGMVTERFDESLQNVTTCSPLLRAITPRDVGNAAVLYAADISSAITGAIVPIDGGMSILLAGSGVHPRAGKAVAERS
jgi:enoyl-[acyl-carrier protein] reductase I